MILMNNQFLSRKEALVDIEDRGYQFGDGIYEVVRVYHGAPFKMEEHLKRFARSAKEIKLTLPMSMDEINEKIMELIEKNNLDTGIVYFQATRGASPRVHHFPKDATSVLTAYTKEMKRPLDEINHGVKVVTLEDIRWLRCDIKSINLLGNVLAKQFAVENDAKEGVQIRGTIVTEGSSSNFFIVKDEKLYTHPATRLILRGITRDVVEELAKQLNIPFIEQEYELKDVYQADEAFITSTTAEVTPVIQVNDHKISETPGPITKKLQEAFEKLI